MNRISSRGHVAAPSLLLVLALLTGCGMGSPSVIANSSSPSSNPSSGSGGSFSVTAVSPAPGSTQVALSAVIQITFSSAAAPSTVDAANIRVTAPNAVAGAVTYNASTNTATFTPSAALQPDSTYTVTVSGVTSSSGTEMAGTFTSSFATVTSSAGSGGGSANNDTCANAYIGLAQTPPCTQYQTFLLLESDKATAGGVAIDTNGKVSLSFASVSNANTSANFTAQPNTEYTVQFCPAYKEGGASSPPACFNVATATSDASGEVDSAFTFPRPGNWAGDFQVSLKGVALLHTTFVNPPQSVQPFQPVVWLYFTLEPETTVNGTGVATGAQDPLSSGSIEYDDKGTVGISLVGASPNSTYAAYESVTPAVGGSGTNELTTFTTDAGGDGGPQNVFTDPFLNPAGGDIFTVEPRDGSRAGFIGGFSVPQ